jgi:hypothetical protein
MSIDPSPRAPIDSATPLSEAVDTPDLGPILGANLGRLGLRRGV